MDMGINPARSHNHVFAGNDFSTRPDDDRYPRLNIRISGFSNSRNPAVLYPDVSFNDSGMVNDDSIRNDGVSRVLRGPLRLAHPISNYFATAKLDLFPVNGEVLLNLNNEIGIGQPDSVSHGRAEHFRVCLSGDFHGINRTRPRRRPRPRKAKLLVTAPPLPSH